MGGPNVRITHGMIAATSLAYLADVDTVLPDDAASAAPMSHGAGLYAPVHVLIGAAHMVPLSGGFDADEVLALSTEKTTSMFMAPRWCADARPCPSHWPARHSIRTIIYGGGPCMSATLSRPSIGSATFVQIYGQGECPMAISSPTRAGGTGLIRIGSPPRIGWPGNSWSKFVDDGIMQPAAHGATGEIPFGARP